MNASRRQRLGLRLAVLGVATVLGACTATNETAPPVTPAVSVDPFPSPSAPVVAARWCGPGDVTIGDVWWTGATAEMGGGFTLLDVSPRACNVAGRPTSLSILDRSGHPLALKVEGFAPEQGTPVIVTLRPTAPTPTDAQVPEPGVQLSWTNWCGSWSRSGVLVVSLPRVGELRAPIRDLSAPRCDAPGQPSVVEVGAVAMPQ